jgi:hypothetical protein
MSLRYIRLVALLVGVLLLAGVGYAGEKGLMHCFAFTPLPNATDADWKAFFAATDQLPSKIEGLQRVWVGKLRAPQKFSPNAGRMTPGWRSTPKSESPARRLSTSLGNSGRPDHPSIFSRDTRVGGAAPTRFPSGVFPHP